MLRAGQRRLIRLLRGGLRVLRVVPGVRGAPGVLLVLVVVGVEADREKDLQNFEHYFFFNFWGI